MTPAERKAADAERQAAVRKRRKDAGLVRCEVWVPAEMAEAAKGLMLAIIKESTGAYRQDTSTARRGINTEETKCT